MDFSRPCIFTCSTLLKTDFKFSGVSKYHSLPAKVSGKSVLFFLISEHKGWTKHASCCTRADSPAVENRGRFLVLICRRHFFYRQKKKQLFSSYFDISGFNTRKQHQSLTHFQFTSSSLMGCLTSISERQKKIKKCVHEMKLVLFVLLLMERTHQ